MSAIGMPLDLYAVTMLSMVDRCRKAGIVATILTTMLAGDWDSEARRKVGEYRDTTHRLATTRQRLLAELYRVIVAAARTADVFPGLTYDGVSVRLRPQPA